MSVEIVECLEAEKVAHEMYLAHNNNNNTIVMQEGVDVETEVAHQLGTYQRRIVRDADGCVLVDFTYKA
jgi:hypothetical protein